MFRPTIVFLTDGHASTIETQEMSNHCISVVGMEFISFMFYNSKLLDCSSWLICYWSAFM